jgi:translation initiation factor eIF-2B subunit delta
LFRLQQGQRTPEDSPRQLGSRTSSRRASEDTPRSASRMYSPQTSNRNSLDQPGGASAAVVGNHVKGGSAVEALPLTPIDGPVESIIASNAGPNEGDLTIASRKAIELLRAEEAMQAKSTTGNKAGPTTHEIPEKKKMTKAERRALQEAQRAAKAAKGEPGGNSKQKETQDKTGEKERRDVRKDEKKDEKDKGGKHQQRRLPATAIPSTLSFFDHLPRRQHFTMDEIAAIAAEKSIPIPCLLLGMKMEEGSLRGTNARSLEFLKMIDEVVTSFELSEGQSFTREFTVAVKNMVSFLVQCRPLSPAMGNVVKSIKAELGHLATQSSLSNEEACAKLRHFVANFAQDKISAAQQVLAGIAAEKIKDGDIILTYARSSTVEQTFKQAAAAGTRFSVVIADSSPLYEGKKLLRELLGAGIPCEYMLFNSLETGMNLANKVMLGVAAVMSNGAVLSRAGTAAVALSASLAHVPVIVCSETYKFHERVQLDSITHNELADSYDMCKASSLNCLNIVYDTTAADFITVVITEVGALPPTSVPVVLREYRRDAELLV